MKKIGDEFAVAPPACCVAVGIARVRHMLFLRSSKVLELKFI
jgi:hypothetical protein